MFQIDLRGKVALVTGGATNIGAACCIRLAQAGAKVAINCYPDPSNPQESSADAEKVLKTILDSGGEAMIFPCDVGVEAQCKEMVQKIADQWGGVDILVNNAVQFGHKKMLDLGREEFLRMFEVNVLGAFTLSKEVIPYMLEKKDGSIIMMSSSNVVNGGGDTPAYPACKAAMEGLMKNMVKEFGPKGIRTNAIRPSVIYTTSMQARYTEQELDDYVKCIPTTRVGLPDDVGNLVVFLCDSEKAAYLNGGLFHVDGARIYQVHP